MKIVHYCKCGASMKLTASINLVEGIEAWFLSTHTGEGHGSCDAKTAARAIAKEETQWIREQEKQFEDIKKDV